VDSFTTNFIPIGAGVVWGPKTENFYQILENQRLVPAYLCTICTKFSGFVGSFMMGHMLKFGEIRSRDSRIRGYNLRWSGYYQIFSAP